MKLAVVWVALLVAILALLFTPAGQGLDRDWTRQAVAWDHASPALHVFMRAGTAIGLAPPVLAALAAYGSFGDEVARRTVRIGLLTLAGSQGCVEVLKRVFRRERPDHDANAGNSSFPSSHSSAAFGLAWVVSARHRRLGLLAWAIALWIGASRVFLGRHFPSDVLGGALVGITFAALSIRLEPRLWRKRGQQQESFRP